SALGALAVFAYLRGLAPGALGIALVLSAAGQFLPPKKPAEWATSTSLLLFGAWVSFAWLCLRDGAGAMSLIDDPARFAIAAAAAVAAAALIWTLRRELGQAWMAAAADLGALTFLTGAAATLEFTRWPAMVGAAAVFAAEAGRLWREARPPAQPGGAPAAALWGLNFLGQAAIAYVFLR
ncbi:MAG: hypothetical protein ACXWVJ_04435, partial [Caulobacteraceae bacterium]